MEGKHLLVSDVDDTMLGDDEALEQFAEWYEAHRRSLGLVYASGRFYRSVVDSIQTTALPEPDAIIGGVGTDIQLYPAGEMIGSWHEKISGKWDSRMLRQTLSHRPELELQPEEFQSPFKVSYYFTDARPEDLQMLYNELQAASLDASMVYSSNRDLDFVPAGVNKGTAAAFLASAWRMSSDNVMVSGDSGNDRALFEQGFLGIVVGNAHPELKRLQGPRIYHASQPFAGGVLEGVRHWMCEV
jgi:sucrose-6F-phosphate phosphohydrolase